MAYQTIISVRRHYDKAKDPVTKESLDKLSKSGLQDAYNTGKNLEYEINQCNHVLGYHSQKFRTRQSIDNIYKGAGLASNYRQDNRLNPAPFPDDLKREEKKRKLSGNPMSNTELCQKILDRSPSSGDGIISVIEDIIKKSDKLNGKVYAAVVSHSPVVEASLIKYLGKRNLNSIRGTFDTGEEYVINIENKDGKKVIKVTYKGMTVQVSPKEKSEKPFESVYQENSEETDEGSEEAEAA